MLYSNCMKLISNQFRGRINRRNYIIGLVTSIGVGFPLLLLTANRTFALLYYLLFLSLILFIWSLHVRRFHDKNMTGWTSIALFIPLVNIIFELMLFFGEGTNGKNQYGEKPNKTIRFPADIFNLN